MVSPRFQTNVNAVTSLTVYALFSSGVASDLNCLTIDSATGHISALKPVKGPAKDYFAKLYGEQTREYPFDSSRGKFFFLDIVQQTASASSPITLYGIDPSTGESTSVVVSGATGNVVSYVYHPESAAMIFSTGFRESSKFSFYTLDLDTAKATLISTQPRGASEGSSPSYYSPYMSEVTSSGQTVLRLGYQQVVVAQGPGMGITPLDGNGTAVWKTVPSVAGEEFFYSLTRIPGEDGFVSLAPSTSANHTLAVVSWDTSGTQPKVILDVPDAHPPSSQGTGILGYVTDTVSAGFYVGLVVKKGALPVGLGDRWEVLSVDLSAASGSSEVLSGHGFDVLGAETVSVSGIGLKKA